MKRLREREFTRLVACIRASSDTICSASQLPAAVPVN